VENELYYTCGDSDNKACRKCRIPAQPQRKDGCGNYHINKQLAKCAKNNSYGVVGAAEVLFEEEQTEGEAGDKFDYGNLGDNGAAWGKDTVHNIPDRCDQTAVHGTIEDSGQKY